MEIVWVFAGSCEVLVLLSLVSTGSGSGAGGEVLSSAGCDG